MAGWSAPTPSHPLTLDEADHGTWDPAARLKRMDEYGIYAAVLYPNVIALQHALFMRMEPEVGFACIHAYNDFLTEFACSTRRLAADHGDAVLGHRRLDQGDGALLRLPATAA